MHHDSHIHTLTHDPTCTERSLLFRALRTHRRSRTRHRVSLPVERCTHRCSMSVPEARGGASPPSGSTSMVLRRRCRHGLAMLHISAQLHRQQLRPAVRHTADYCHHARYSCRCRWCHCVRPCSWPWSTSVRKSFALLHVQLHHARDRSSRSAGAVSRVVPHGG